MPLHLLGKKSWNVYNADNISRVKKDEAAAAAREDAEEQRMQEVDAERRVKLLRGESTTPLPSKEAARDEDPGRPAERDDSGRERKRRRIHGEDDTERDIRYAQEDLSSRTERRDVQPSSKKSSDAPLTDQKGNINLFPVVAPKKHHHKNAEAEAEKKRKEKELEDQYTMRFSNAAGFKQSIGQKPWYHGLGQEQGSEEVSKDVWGNEDPRRKEREKQRIQVDDPLAMIKRGVQGVRQVEKERRQWVQEKQREIRDLEDEEERERRRRRRRKMEKEKRRHRHDGHGDNGEKDGDSKHRHRQRHRDRDRKNLHS